MWLPTTFPPPRPTCGTTNAVVEVPPPAAPFSAELARLSSQPQLGLDPGPGPAPAAPPTASLLLASAAAASYIAIISSRSIDRAPIMLWRSPRGRSAV